MRRFTPALARRRKARAHIPSAPRRGSYAPLLVLILIIGTGTWLAPVIKQRLQAYLAKKAVAAENKQDDEEFDGKLVLKEREISPEPTVIPFRSTYVQRRYVVDEGSTSHFVQRRYVTDEPRLPESEQRVRRPESSEAKRKRRRARSVDERRRLGDSREAEDIFDSESLEKYEEKRRQAMRRDQDQ